MLREPTVFVVDDDEAVRRSFEWLVGSVDLRAETYASARDFLEAFDPERPGCLVLDVRMPDMGGLELLAQLKKQKAPLPVIVISGYGDVSVAVRSMKYGAIDFIEKPANDEVVLERIRLGIERNTALRRDHAARVEIAARLERLTPREREVLAQMVGGGSNKEIGRELSISPRTVEIHRSRVMSKMEARAVTDLVRMWDRANDLRDNPYTVG